MSTESKQKRADFHPPLTHAALLQAVIDTGGVADELAIPLLKDISLLEMRIKLTIRKWKRAYSAFAELSRRWGSKRQRKKQVGAVVKAEKVLEFWLPWLSAA